MSYWIKCSEQLPFTPANLADSEALGHQFYDSKPVLCLVQSEFSGTKPYMRVGRYDGFTRNWTEFETNEYRGTSHVTHWMPLPEPPKP